MKSRRTTPDFSPPIGLKLCMRTRRGAWNWLPKLRERARRCGRGSSVNISRNHENHRNGRVENRPCGPESDAIRCRVPTRGPSPCTAAAGRSGRTQSRLQRAFPRTPMKSRPTARSRPPRTALKRGQGVRAGSWECVAKSRSRGCPWRRATGRTARRPAGTKIGSAASVLRGPAYTQREMSAGVGRRARRACLGPAGASWAGDGGSPDAIVCEMAHVDDVSALPDGAETMGDVHGGVLAELRCSTMRGRAAIRVFVVRDP